MKKNLLTISTALMLLVTCAAFISFKHSTGMAGNTASPGESSCAQIGCHSGGTSIASGLTITAVPSFSANQYVPGTTYTVNVLVGALSFSNFGFGCEILNSGNTNAGTMQNAGAGVQFLTAGNGRKNATHTAPKAGSNFASFSFEWVAPASGAVNIYAAGNCVNLNGTTSGDLVVTNSVALTAASASSVKENNSMINGLNIYPNPASESINFNYNLKESGKLTVDLYSINGQKVASLISEEKGSGFQHQSVKIPSEINSGVYFVKISLNNNNVAQRLISVK